MNNDRELLQQALDALESECDATKFGVTEAIRARLAQPDSATHSADSAESFCKPEPMACSVIFPRHAPKHGEDWIIDPSFLLRVYHSIDPDAHYGFIPTMEEIETALLALEVIPSNLYTAPPQREWVGLTKKETLELLEKNIDKPFSLLVAVRDKLKANNDR